MSHPPDSITAGFNINTRVKLDDPGLAIIVFAKLADEMGLSPGRLAEIIQSGMYAEIQLSPRTYLGPLLEPIEN